MSHAGLSLVMSVQFAREIASQPI